ncbi:unnamed protein product [Heligmosomoides polygyrus]|uniref:ZP domain-containing protein n=1 Tax=Heligmosomoides polygyrus TaxID=6339 RepID=A0A3P7YQM5_HELPZ|nr:unnamed protein product [Heligmosomoides polygyrus]
MASAPYDMAVITENCKRAKKSPHLLRDMPLNDTTVSGAQIVGHTVVLSNDNGVVACATVILPGAPLLRASFHTDTIEGHVHLIPMQNKVRILPDLRYDLNSEDEEPKKGILEWAFVTKCGSNVSELSVDANELGVDSRTTITFTDMPINSTLRMFALLFDRELIACSPIVNVEIHLVSKVDVEERDDCLDMATETVHKNYGIFYPSLNIFGPDTVVLKSLVADNSCGPLRPQFPRPASTSYFIHPIVGRLVLVDMDDRILLTGELRQLFDSSATRATVQVSRELVSIGECPRCEEAGRCYTVEDAAVIVGNGEPMVTLTGVFPWFEIGEMRSIIVDLHWTKVCNNLTHLPSGALSAHALIRRISATASPVVASIVVLEYPANNYTEALVNKHQVFSSATAHVRPLDQSITSSIPCGEGNLGPSEEVRSPCLGELHSNSGKNFRVIIGSKQLVTGEDSVLGTSVLLSDGHDVSCGHFEPLTEKTIAVAKFDSDVVGFMKLTQYGTTNWATGIPTEIYYSLAPANKSRYPIEELELVWQFVDERNFNCSDAPLFNPFAVNGSVCSPETIESCLMDEVLNTSRNLTMNTRQHLVVSDLPLTGPYSVTADFLNMFKVQFDYTREVYKARCNIYRVTILEEDWRISEILSMFNVEQKKFASDADFDCGDQIISTTATSGKDSATSAFMFFIVFFAIHFISYQRFLLRRQVWYQFTDP